MPTPSRTAKALENSDAKPALAAEDLVPSFAVIYEQYFDFVWSLTRRFGVEPASIDDIVQEIFMVVHAKIQSLRQPDSLRSWIYGARPPTHRAK
jgi:RNA polymerase sigma-70 factor, ECF subfamily